MNYHEIVSFPVRYMSKRKPEALHPEVKRLLGYDQKQSDREVLKHWKSLSTRVCKPCWELRYCPYGPLVEQSPLLPPIRKDAIQHNEYLKECLRTNRLADGTPVTPKKRRAFQQSIKDFDSADYPPSIPSAISEMECSVFCHIVRWFTQLKAEPKPQRTVEPVAIFLSRPRCVSSDETTTLASTATNICKTMR